MPCPAGEAEGYGEYYDLLADPHQQRNEAKSLQSGKREMLSKRLAELKACQGQAGCS